MKDTCSKNSNCKIVGRVCVINFALQQRTLETLIMLIIFTYLVFVPNTCGVLLPIVFEIVQLDFKSENLK